MLLCSIKMQKIQIFYEGLVMFVVTCSLLINIAEEENISFNVTLKKKMNQEIEEMKEINKK